VAVAVRLLFLLSWLGGVIIAVVAAVGVAGAS